MKKVFAYIRVSDPSQIKRDGFARQLKAIKDYATSNKLQVVEVFREEGVSGTIEHRPALARMLISLERNNHGVKAIIIEKLDRLARDLMVQEAIIRDFRKSGFEVISTTEGADLCSDDATRKLLRQMMRAIAEYEKTMVVMRLRIARERKKALTGKCEGTKRYDESPAGRSLIRKIVRMRSAPKHHRKMTYRQIADYLNEKGLLTLEGERWTLHRVAQVYGQYKNKRKFLLRQNH